MTYGQVDPARLQGDAFRQWYLRTPAEIEGERAAAAERAYNTFFSQPGGRALSDSGNTARSATAPTQNDFRTVGNTPGRWLRSAISRRR